LKIGEDWYSFGSLKKDVINVKDGSGWTQVTKGMEVEFMFKENGSFKNVQKASFSITDKSNAQATPAPKQQQSGGGFVNPAQRGQAMNLAAEVLGYKKADFGNAKKVVEAIKWYLDVCADFESLWDTAEKQRVAKNTPVEKEDKPPFKEDAPQYDEDIDFEDDI